MSGEDTIQDLPSDKDETINSDKTLSVGDDTNTNENTSVDVADQLQNNETSTVEEKTEEGVNKTEQLNSRTSRELKLLLELSKEANLDTNIGYKRKSLEAGKLMDKLINRTSTTVNIDSREEPGKRSMRSQNPDFLAKHKFMSKFLPDSENQGISENDEKGTKDLNKSQKRKKESLGELFTDGAIDEKTRKLLKPVLAMIQNDKDGFCWRCHRDKINLSCGTCPRSYHSKCLKQSSSNIERWVCPECVSILTAESTKTRSSSMKDMSLEHFCGLLKFALKRMTQCMDAEPFRHPVNTAEFPDYIKYIVEPMDLTRIEKNINDNLYGSTNAFEADAKWMLHNSIIFNSYQSKLTSIAKSIIKVCKQEMQEIENCATCYLNANTKKEWFVEVCPKPHVLLWAKLKGFPYWPAKAMCTNSQGMVDVRFFGAHDRAWVPFKECFLFSLKDPNCNKQKRNDIIECLKEVDFHIENLKTAYGEFEYAPYRTPYDPEMETKQLQIFLPSYKPDAKCSPEPKARKVSSAEGESETRNSPERENEKIRKECYEDKTTVESEVNKSSPSEKTALKCSSDTENSLDTHSQSDELNKAMEGYGTDDELDENNHDFDEQNHMEVVTAGQNHGRVRIRGGFNNTSGKLRLIPKQITDNLKRPSNDDISESPQKVSRRNSDESIQVDSPIVSEKINEVNVSENMEVTFCNGEHNSTVLENPSPSPNKLTKLSNIKLPVDVSKKSTLSKKIKITPPHKWKIADRLMKKLRNTDEDTNNIKNKKISSGIVVNNSIASEASEETQNGNNALVPILTDTVSTNVNSDTLSSSDIQSPPIDSNNPEISNNIDNRTGSIELSTINDLMEKNLYEELNPSNSDELLEEMYSENIEARTTPGPSETTDTNELQKSDDSITQKSNTDITINESLRGSSPIQKRLIKLVDISTIKQSLTTKITPELVTNSLLQRHLNNLNSLNNTKEAQRKSTETNAQVIKSEPNSDEEVRENTYTEAKRQYMSALNISEKSRNKSKQNNMSSKSKADETPRFQVVDNLTKIIDTVASNCSEEYDNEAVSRDSVTKVILKQRARKSFPRSNPIPKQKLPFLSKPVNNINPSITSSVIKTVTSLDSQNIGNVVFLAQHHPSVSNIAVLPPNQTIAYTTSTGSPLLTMVQQPAPGSFTNIIVPAASINLSSSTQNYIPQRDATTNELIDATLESVVQAVVAETVDRPIQSNTISETVMVTSTNTPITVTTPTTNTATNTAVSVTPTSNTSVPGNVTLLNGQSVTQNVPSNSNRQQTSTTDLNDDFNFLNGFVPETITKAITDLMCRAPPKLKPRPPGPLSTNFDPGVPSSAGCVASYINSVSHRLTDYFRGMLIETLQDVGNTENPQALITSLKLENEALKHRHSEELLEIKKNVNSILRDIQKSVLEERERIIEETRAVCEAETIKRVEEAKSKQWCTNCMKEAQFYCCWNTSYCDYPCQLKHWPKHMTKCAQNIGSNLQPLSSNSSPKTQVQPLILRKAIAPKTFVGKTLIAKHSNVLKSKSVGTKMSMGTVLKTPSGSTLTIVEPTPGSYELVGNGPISVGGKIINTTVLNKIKPGNIITVSSASASLQSPGGITSSQKFIVTQTKSPVATKPIASTNE